MGELMTDRLYKFFVDNFVGHLYVFDDGVVEGIDCVRFEVMSEIYKFPYYTRKALELFPELKEKALPFVILGKNGRRYTYYLATDEITKRLIESRVDDITKLMVERAERKEESKEISQRECCEV